MMSAMSVDNPAIVEDVRDVELLPDVTLHVATLRHAAGHRHRG